MKQKQIRRYKMRVQQTSRIGLRCKAYQAGCIVCDSYRFFDESGRFPYSFEEANAFSQEKQREDESEEST
jgi:hypothetical protein